MNYSLRRFFLILLFTLVANGCTLPVNEATTERCVKNPFVSPVENITKSDFEIGYFKGKSFHLSSIDGRNDAIIINGSYPYWSPDKQKIAYIEANEICIASTKDGHLLQITNDKLAKSDITWSPSGQYLAFTVNHIEKHDLLGSYNNGEIYISSLDGVITRLTNSPESSDNNPSWSPDETMIAFYSYSDPVDTGGHIVYTVTISIVNLVGDKQIAITKDGVKPIWFPDGKQLLFESFDGQICRIDLEGQNRFCITSGYDDYAPQFSPNGEFIAFTRIDKGWSIYTMKPDGSEQTWLANGIFPIWSPDGNRIAFSTGGENSDIYTINTDGTNPLRIAKNAWGYSWFQP